MNSKGFNLPILAPCSSSSRATEEQTTLYFCVSCCEDPDAPLESYEDHKDWYSINPKQPPNQPYDKLSRVTRMPSSSCFSPTYISSTVLGSKIHVFGAFYTDSDEVPLGPLLLTYDTLTNKWHNNLPHTEADRISPLLVTCGGILFAIGCERTLSVRYPWAECFDQNQNRWISLPNPPIKLGHFSTYPTSSVVLDDTKFLINVSGCPHMLVFDICTWKWTTVDCPDYPKNRSLNCKMVVVGDMLYMFFGCMMYAYNFSKGGKSLKKVRNLDRLPSSIAPPEGEVFPFHLGGGNFCEVWSRHGPGMTSVILCMNFHVNLVTDYRGKKILEATIDGCNSYTVDGGFIKDCVAVTS